MAWEYMLNVEHESGESVVDVLPIWPLLKMLVIIFLSPHTETSTDDTVSLSGLVVIRFDVRSSLVSRFHVVLDDFVVHSVCGGSAVEVGWLLMLRQRRRHPELYHRTENRVLNFGAALYLPSALSLSLWLSLRIVFWVWHNNGMRSTCYCVRMMCLCVRESVIRIIYIIDMWMKAFIWNNDIIPNYHHTHHCESVYQHILREGQTALKCRAKVMMVCRYDDGPNAIYVVEWLLWCCDGRIRMDKEWWTFGRAFWSFLR